jgi:pimeloyl-ACP methyl ester carboxylesterase
MRIAFVCGALSWVPLLHATGASTEQHVTFSDYSPLSSNAELARRLLSPLTAAQLPQLLQRAGAALSEQPIDLAAEEFLLYVPAAAPPQGYALLVFVPPWPQAQLPRGWAAVLNRHHVIFVSAAHSGNEANVLARREPLALLAEHNVAARYRLDPGQIYVGGFSGGARVALRLALAYPDVFRGAILNAGSDPIGDSTTPLPARELFSRFQESSRLIYVTGAADQARLQMADGSMRSMRQWCVFDVRDQIIRRATRDSTSHEEADAGALEAALDGLLQPAKPDAAKLAACRRGIEHELDARLAAVRALLAEGKSQAARAALDSLDKRFGGLAAPSSLELQREIAQQPE